MADTGTFCSGSEVLQKAGSGASTTSDNEEYTNNFIKQAESWINCATRKNYSDSYSGLNADVKNLLKECASNLAAIYVINYDIGGYTSRTEAEFMINVLKTRADEIIEMLVDKKVETFILGA